MFCVMVKKLARILKTVHYRSDFTVIYSSSTGRILREEWVVKFKRLPFFPWITLPGSTRGSWEELKSYAKSELGVELEFCSHGKSRRED